MTSEEQRGRHHRQILLPSIGTAGQERLRKGRVCLLGVGALGSQVAALLVRAGVGFLRLVDRDVVEWTNLQRQVLYEEADVEAGLPKVVAAARALARIDHSVRIEPVVQDVDASSIRALIEDVDVVVDGSDNFELRYLLNDAALELGKPWVYGGAVGTQGTTLTVVPGEAACLRCIFPDPPPPGVAPTCDTAGVLGPVVAVIGALQASEVIKLLVGDRASLNRSLLSLDLWSLEIARIPVTRRVDCPACGRGERAFLQATAPSRTVQLCGRDAVQVSVYPRPELDLTELAARLAPLGAVQHNPYLIRFIVDGYELTVFRDGRAIVRGTTDPAVARTLYARYVGM
ncbi:ThiF family adenylyltransferase [Thermomicrobium sp. 4228-Ro]|uniref:ThiF family adenylyltransferase n=1 Tax=Thermomicrobium sp. 4228-Ro TaxID=2993937 RepID=UPI002249318F|nr:ThiF family adenylyltransferase [Thermomicrobium sp. 4228-Ro]MCX2727171.1 ThiF family adenylyltransferase [Thermomicrobium sp. 4228-Ro]